MTSDSVTLPRRVVLDQAWRSAGLADSVLSGRDGAPLARTVKCLIDPLIVRPKLAHHNRGCSWGLNPPVSSNDLAM